MIHLLVHFIEKEQSLFPGFPGGLVVENAPANEGNTGLIPRLERPPGGLSPWGCKELDPTEHACMHTFLLSLSLSLQSGMWS